VALKIEIAEREFIFDAQILPDPGSEVPVERVREIYMPVHPEITTATVVGPELVNGKMRYTFNRKIGDKG
jgi:PRTRC genetic system protein C